MKLLSVLLAALALPASASAATFSEPETIADWGTTQGFAAVADGALAWSQSDGVRLRSGGATTLIGDGPFSVNLAVAPVAGDAPRVGWNEPDGPHFWAGGADTVPAGALTNTRAIAVTPNLAAWLGVDSGGGKHVQTSRRDGTGWQPAQTLPPAEPSAYGLVAASAQDGRGLLAWSTESDDLHRIQLAAVAADGTVAPTQVMPGTTTDATSPAVAMGPDGTAVIAWSLGLPSGRVQVRLRRPDGTLTPVESVDQEGGSGPPSVAIGPDGTAVVAWRGGAGSVSAAVRAPLAGEFAEPAEIEAGIPSTVAAAVTSAGHVLVAWTSDGRALASVRPAGSTFGAAIELAGSGVTQRLAAGGDRIVWSELRERPGGGDFRIRSATLASAPPTGGGDEPDADRAKPRVRLRVLGLRGRRLRVRVTSDENAIARLIVRSGGRRASGPYTGLAAGTPRAMRVKVPRGRGRLRLELRVRDRAGNVRVVRRSLRRPA